jgi:predicted nuclease with TOPRIM domain
MKAEVIDMSDYSSDVILEHTKNIATLKADVNNLRDRMEDMSEIRNAVVKLTVLQEEQAKFSADVSETLKGINENLNILNTETKDTNQRVSSLEMKVEKIDEKSKVDILNLIVKAVPWLISLGLGTYILQVISK